jgi:hypothetical protein
MDKVTPSNLREEAQRLIAAGKMPKLEDLLESIASTRKKFVPQIHDARKEPQQEQE